MVQDAFNDFYREVAFKGGVYHNPNEKVELDISIQPSATLFRTGETLVVVVQGHDFNEYGPHCQIPRAGTGLNHGQHTIFPNDSYLELPATPYKFA